MAAYITRPDWYGNGAPDPLEPTGRPLKWGIVATGNISTTVAGDLALLPDAELYAVSSRSEANAIGFAQKFGIPQWYADDPGRKHGWAYMFEDPEVDVVYIGSPHGQHYEIASAALRAGKNVLCEKALTINAAEAQELVRQASEAGVFFMEAVWARFVPGYQRALEIIDSGELGEIRWVSADLGFNAPQDPDSRIWSPRDGGGALLDLTVYPLLWALAGLGFPDSVHASAVLTGWGVDEQNALTLSYSVGAQAQLMSSLVAQGPRLATVSGSRGYMQTVGSVNNPSGLVVRSDWQGSRYEIDRVEEFDIVGRGYTYELREVTRCIHQGLVESPTMTWQDSINVMRFFDGVRAQIGLVYPHDAV